MSFVLSADIILFTCFAESEQAHYRTIIPSLLANRVALLPTATAERGIRLPRQLSGCTAGKMDQLCKWQINVNRRKRVSRH